MLRFQDYGLPSGITAAAETYEAAFSWEKAGLCMFKGALIDAATIDSGNSPNYELRPGLLLGQKITAGTWTNYAAGNTDGSEVAAGILISAVRMQDFQGTTRQLFYGIQVGGPVKASMIIGLDGQARQQMSARFALDDDLPGRFWFDWKREIALTANYIALSTDNNTLFNNTGATGAVTVTLPPILPGYKFGIRGIAAQNLAITSNEGTNIIADGNASASTLTLSTSGHIIGGGVLLFSNPQGTKWHSIYYGSGTGNTITVT